jgi:hypothetical protein
LAAAGEVIATSTADEVVLDAGLEVVEAEEVEGTVRAVIVPPEEEEGALEAVIVNSVAFELDEGPWTTTMTVLDGSAVESGDLESGHPEELQGSIEQQPLKLIDWQV